jgi:hypothetical protein
MQLQANGVDYSGTFTVPAGERVEKMLTARAVDGKIAVVATASTGAHAGMDTFHAVRVDPLIAHVPIRRLMPGEDLVVRATVAGVDEIRRCELTYGDSLSGFHAVPLRSSGGSLVYRATIPGGRLGKGGTEYFIEAEDAAGRVGRWPESGRARVLVSADVLPPLVRFTPILTAVPGRPLRIVVQAGDPSGIRWVRVRYRNVTHFQDYRILELLPTGHPNEFAAEIPGVDLDPRFDFMYFIEAMDGAGNGAIYPDMEKETPYVVVNLHP